MKKNLIKNLAQKIARTLLKICAITYKKEPYKWASGMLMKIYSDNRMLLNNYQHRWRTAQGFKKLLKGKEFDYLLGIPTAGIAPAASLAQLMDKHLLVNMGEYFIDYPNDLWGNKLNKETRWVGTLKEMLTDNNINIIVTYGTEMIPYGVQLANITKLPFAYLRKQPKDHGKGKQIEGILPKNAIPFVIFDGNKSTKAEILNAFPGKLKTENIFNIHSCSAKKFSKITKFFESSAVAIEDLISTGGSSALEIYKLRLAGAKCDLCLCNYDYGFEIALNQFAGSEPITKTDMYLNPSCELKSILTFDELYEEMERINHFTPEIRKAMKEEVAGFDERFKKMVVETATS